MAGYGSCEGVLLLVLAPWAQAPPPPPTYCRSQPKPQSKPRRAASCFTCSGDTIGGNSVSLSYGETPGPTRTCLATPWPRKLTLSESTDTNVEPLLTLNLSKWSMCDRLVLVN